MKKSKFLAAVSIAALFTATGAQAASVSSLLFPSTLFEDDSAEAIIDRGAQNNLLEIGDSLRGILNIGQLVNQDDTTQVNSLSPSSGNNELSGVFQTIVVDRTFQRTVTLVDPSGVLPTIDVDYYDYVFGPDPAFVAEFGLAAGATIALFEDPIHEFAQGGTSCTTAGTLGDCEANIIDGSFWASLGFGDPDDLWVTTSFGGAPENVGAGAYFSATTDLSTFLVQLTVLDNNTGVEWDQIAVDAPSGQPGADGFTNFIGGGSIQGIKGFDTPYDVIDDTNYQGAPIPEPSVIALMGLGLFGAALARRRRKV